MQEVDYRRDLSTAFQFKKNPTFEPAYKLYYLTIFYAKHSKDYLFYTI